MLPLPFHPSLLVGRERELILAHERFAAAVAGHGGLALIGGEAGIGKTAFAEALCRHTETRGACVLVGRCYDLTETPPYGPWVELLGRYRRTPDALPALPSAFAARDTVGTVTNPLALFREIHAFFAALAEQRPLVLLLDDLHWADPASLDLLRFLAREIAGVPLLILATYRSDELSLAHPLAHLLPALARESRATRLDLPRLQIADVRVLIAGHYDLAEVDRERLVAHLYERAEGNPFFTEEILCTLDEGRILRPVADGWQVGDLTRAHVPPLVRQVIEGRLARLDDERRQLLTVAAVIGQEVPLSLWAEAANVKDTALFPTIERASAAHLMAETPDGTGMRFVHALIRETLYEAMTLPVRRTWHRQVAEALAVHANADPDAVASHFQRAGDDRALPWLLQAGERAQAAYARTMAAARFEAALALMERTDSDVGERGWLLLRLSRLLQFVEVAKARAFVDAAFPLAQAANDRSLAAFARFQGGLLACFAGNVVDGLPELEAAADAMAALTDAERDHHIAHAAAIADGSRVLEGRGGVVAWRAYAGRYREARELGEQLVAEASGGNEEMLQSLREGFGGLGDAYAALGMPDEAETIYAIARQAFVRAEHHVLAANAAMRELDMVALPYRAGSIETRRLAEWAVAERERTSGAVPASIPPRVVCLSLLVLEGKWEEAERLTLAGNAEARATIGFRTSALRHLAALARLRGDAERAWRTVREWLPAGPATVPGTFAPFDAAIALQRVAAALAMDEGDLPSAKEWLNAHDRWLEWSGTVLGRSEGQVLWAQYYRQSGDFMQARLHVERALTHATAPRQPLALLAAHRLLGELAADDGKFDRAAEHLRTALDLADRCAAPYERAQTLVALATLAQARSDMSAAREALSIVRSICTRLGARPLLVHADALAAHIDANASARFPAGLSGREVEILRLIAAGHTNRQIAAMLSLSERTVHSHVRNVFTKTHTDNRAAATAFAFRHDLA